MLEVIKPIIGHVIAVFASLFVIFILINVLKVDSEIIVAVLALVVVALEKLIREVSKDWVNS